MKITKIIIAVAFLLAIQSSNIFAQTAFYEVEKLFDDQKFTEVLKAIDAVLPQVSGEERLMKAYYMRGSSRFNAIYQARTGIIFGTDKVFDENRPRFELTYSDNNIKILDGAISDLKQAHQIGLANLAANKEDTGFAYRFKNTEFEIKKMEALTYLEKAQFVTNSNADFLTTRTAFENLEPLYTVYLGGGAGFIEDFTRYKKGEVLAAELRSKMALGQIDDANLLFDKWMKGNGLSLKKEIAFSSMVEAFDMVGNYKNTEAFLIREAIRQITIDKGKVVPGNLALHKAAMRSHLANLNFAIRIPTTDKLLTFQRARLASAYNVKGNLTPAESAFIKNAPDVIKTDKNTPPFDVQLLSLMLKLQSTDKKETASAMKMLDEMLKKDGTNAAILAVCGYSKMLSNDFAGAETDLSAAIKKDPFLAFAYKAFENRSEIYKKLGKADLAAKDEKEHNRFQQLLALLAAA